jgi:hypothetical protein
MRLAALSTLAAITISLAVSGSAAGERRQVIVVQVKLCTPTEVKGAVRGFVRAFNEGSARLLDRAFASEPDFRWYATDGPGGRAERAVSDRARLLPYFAARHARNELLTITSMRVNGNTISSGNLKSYGNFELRLTRQAADLPRAAYAGKGSLHCYASRPDQLIVWAMGRDG